MEVMEEVVSRFWCLRSTDVAQCASMLRGRKAPCERVISELRGRHGGKPRGY